MTVNHGMALAKRLNIPVTAVTVTEPWSVLELGRSPWQANNVPQPSGSSHEWIRDYTADIASRGQGAWRSTRSVVLPRRASRTPWWPAVGIQIKSTLYSVATSKIDCTTLPCRNAT